MEVEKKEEMKAPAKNQWKIVRAVGKIMGAVRYKGWLVLFRLVALVKFMLIENFVQFCRLPARYSS